MSSDLLLGLLLLFIGFIRVFQKGFVSINESLHVTNTDFFSIIASCYSFCILHKIFFPYPRKWSVMVAMNPELHLNLTQSPEIEVSQGDANICPKMRSLSHFVAIPLFSLQMTIAYLCPRNKIITSMLFPLSNNSVYYTLNKPVHSCSFALFLV